MSIETLKNITSKAPIKPSQGGSFAVGTIMVVAVAMIGSISVLPAVLSKLGDRVERGRIPVLHKWRSKSESRTWDAIIDRVLKRPAVSGGLALALLVTLSIPAFGLKMGVPGSDSLPRSLPVMQTFDRIQAAFPGGPLPATVAVQAKNVRSPRVKAAIAALTARAIASGDAAGLVAGRHPGATWDCPWSG